MYIALYNYTNTSLTLECVPVSCLFKHDDHDVRCVQ